MTNRSLDFSSIEGTEPETGDGRINRMKRWKSREPTTTVQISMRLPEEVYERYRVLCQQERRTNGDMLRVLMEGYFSREEKRP